MKGIFPLVLVALAACHGHHISDTRTNAVLDRASMNPMPNIGFVLSGYDLFEGNPVPTFDGRATPDPGYRQAIFAAEYSDSTTADTRYSVPDGVDILSCSGSCRLNFQSTFISGAKSYRESLESKASVSGSVPIHNSGIGASFSASADYKHVEEETSSGENLFVQSEASCCAYTAKLHTFTPPPFHPNFLAALETLTEKYDAAVYRKFIRSFGTHYLKKATMGSVFGQQSELTAESWSKMVQDGVSVGASAGFSGYGVTAAASQQVTKEKTAAENFKKETKEQKVYSHGAAPPADGNAETWMQNTISDPATLVITLESIDKLPLEDQVSRTVVSNIKYALQRYCDALKAEGKISSCEAPGPDPPLPRTWQPWSNDGTWGSEKPVQECPQGEYVTNMRWRRQRGYGIIDMDFTCSGDNSWGRRATGVNGGAWNGQMSCGEGDGDGFRAVTGRWQRWYGIVNAHAFCLNSNRHIAMWSNSNMNGKDDEEQACPDGQRVVGAQVRHQPGHGITNFRVRCA